MNVVDRLKKIAEISTRRLQHFVVAKVREETHKTFAKEIHEVVKWFAAISANECKIMEIYEFKLFE